MELGTASDCLELNPAWCSHKSRQEMVQIPEENEWKNKLDQISEEEKKRLLQEISKDNC